MVEGDKIRDRRGWKVVHRIEGWHEGRDCHGARGPDRECNVSVELVLRELV